MGFPPSAVASILRARLVLTVTWNKLRIAQSVGSALWPPGPVRIATIPVTGTVPFATGRGKYCERRFPTQSSYSDTSRLVPPVVAAAIVRHAAVLARWRRAVKADGPMEAPFKPGQLVRVNLAGMQVDKVTFHAAVTDAVGNIVKQTSEDPPQYLVRLLFSFRGISEVVVPADRIRAAG
jgi:hypothetical protein